MTGWPFIGQRKSLENKEKRVIFKNMESIIWGIKKNHQNWRNQTWERFTFTCSVISARLLGWLNYIWSNSMLLLPLPPSNLLWIFRFSLFHFLCYQVKETTKFLRVHRPPVIGALPSSWHPSCRTFSFLHLPPITRPVASHELFAPLMWTLWPWTHHVVSVIYTSGSAAFPEMPLQHTHACTHSNTVWLITL